MMQTEHWALLISSIALAISMGIPIWQHRVHAAQAIASKRTLLLQSILSARSINYVASHELRALIGKHGSRMGPNQKANLDLQLPKMREQNQEIERLHEVWRNMRNPSLEEVEEGLRMLDVINANAQDTADLIQTGAKSYEDT